MSVIRIDENWTVQWNEQSATLMKTLGREKKAVYRRSMGKTFHENLFVFIYFLRHFCIYMYRRKKGEKNIFYIFDRLNCTSRQSTIYADIKLSISAPVGKSNRLKNWILFLQLSEKSILLKKKKTELIYLSNVLIETFSNLLFIQDIYDARCE